MNLNLKRLAGLLGLAAAIGLSNAASASTLNVIVSNLDIQFSGATGTLFEVDDSDFGASSPGDAQTVTSAEFELDGIQQALILDPVGPPEELFVDFLIDGVGATLPLGAPGASSVGSGGGPADFALDLFTTDGVSLQIAIDSIDFLFAAEPGTLFFSAGGTVLSQNLPNGLAFTDDVNITFSAADAAFLGGGASTTGFLASGSLQIAGPGVVPEPTSACLAGAVLVGGTTMLRRRRSA